MSITEPLLTEDKISINLESQSNPSFDKFTKDYILQEISVSPISTLNIKKIEIVDLQTGKDAVSKIDLNQTWMNDALGEGKGKSIGKVEGGSITNYLFYLSTLFEDIIIDNPIQGISLPKNLCNYIIHHELGHCYDHSTRGEINAKIITDKDPFIIADNIEKSLYMFRGELSACVFSNYAADDIVLKMLIFNLNDAYKKYFNWTNYRKIKLAKDSSEIYLTNFYFSIFDLCWCTIHSYAKIIGIRLNNPSLAQAPINFSPLIPAPVISLLEKLENTIIKEWKYPELPDSINTEVLKTVDNIASVHGYKFIHSQKGDFVQY